VSRQTVHVRLFIFRALLEGCACDRTCSSRCFCRVVDISSSSSNRLISAIIFGRLRDLASASLDVELRRRLVLCKSSIREHDEFVEGMLSGSERVQNGMLLFPPLCDQAPLYRMEYIRPHSWVGSARPGVTRTRGHRSLEWFQIFQTFDGGTQGIFKHRLDRETRRPLSNRGGRPGWCRVDATRR